MTLLFQYDDDARQALAASASWKAASARATLAARSVTAIFGHRLFGVPGTHFGVPYVPTTPAGQQGLWHYWWQAHYVDCLVDAGWREYITGTHVTGAAYPSAGKLGALTIKTVGLRNGFKFTNLYFDDMAWMALAAQRSEELAKAAKKDERRERKIARYLKPVLHAAQTDDLGGGLFWHTVRDFKNTAATGPAALYFARSGEPERAAPLVDWLFAHLLCPDNGLLMDGLRMVQGRTELVADIFTYNQGPVLGVMLQLGRAKDFQTIAELVQKIAQHLTLEDGVTLKTHGGGDGGLFTGILCRYLGLVARDQRVDELTRTTAEALIRATARNLWERRTQITWKGKDVIVFPGGTAPEETAGELPFQFAQQLQAWMILEAQARLELNN